MSKVDVVYKMVRYNWIHSLIVYSSSICKDNRVVHTYVIDLVFTVNDTELFRQIHNKYSYTRSFSFDYSMFSNLQVFYHNKDWARRIVAFFHTYSDFVITHLWHRDHMGNSY